VWTDEPAELAACRRLVAFYCLYGVDKNPWRLNWRVYLCGLQLQRQIIRSLSSTIVWCRAILCLESQWTTCCAHLPEKDEKGSDGRRATSRELALYFSRAELDARLQRAFRHLREIDRLETEQPGDFEDQQMASLIMQQELAPFVEAHYLRIGRAFLEEDDPAADPMIPNRWMQEIQDQHLISEETRTSAEVAIAKGKEVRAFCWELTFRVVLRAGYGRSWHSESRTPGL